MSAQTGENNGAAVTRRTFLSYLAGSISAFIGIVAGIPIVGYLVAPLRVKEAARWLSIGKVEEFQGTEPKMVSVPLSRRDGWVEVREARICWVVPQPDRSFAVFNGRCTHLGCAYSWRTQADQFLCPCHDGLYDRDGRVLGGPPPRPLDRLETKVENGELIVLYQDFQSGVPQKVTL